MFVPQKTLKANPWFQVMSNIATVTFSCVSTRLFEERYSPPCLWWRCVKYCCLPIMPCCVRSPHGAFGSLECVICGVFEGETTTSNG